MISVRSMEGVGGGAADPGDQLRKVRASIVAALGRLAGRLGSSGLSESDNDAGHSPPVRLDPSACVRVGESLEGEFDDMLEDAAKRGITESGARALLLTADIIRWLWGGEDLPGDGAIELLEVHVAIFNGAPHEEEQQSQRDLVAVLLALVDARSQAIHGGRWRQRNISVEAAERREREKFGDNLERLRKSHDLTIGELATGADIKVLRLVALIYAAGTAGSIEIRRLAAALEVEPGTLFPDPPAGASAAPATEEDPAGGGQHG